MGWDGMGYGMKLSGALLASSTVLVPAGGTAHAPIAWEQDRLKIVKIEKCWTVFRIQVGVVNEGNGRYFSGSRF